MEVKPGGVWRFMMHGPDGVDYPNKIIFNKVEKPALLAYTHSSDDENDPNLFESIIIFEEKDGQTNIIMRAIFATAEERERVVKEYGAEEGGK